MIQLKPLKELLGLDGSGYAKLVEDSDGKTALALKNVTSGTFTPVMVNGATPNEVPVTVALP
jgi:hypothetical protein